MNKFIIAMLFGAVFSVQAETVKVPLSYATGSNEDVVLRGQSQTISVPISVLDGQEVESVRLSLAVFNDNVIDKTLLWIAAGNHSLANVEVKQRNRYQYIEFSIPFNLLSKRKPTLNLRIQHLSNDLSSSVDTTTLNTVIGADDSYYELNYLDNKSDARQTLLSFEEMIRSGQHHDTPVHLISALGTASSLVAEAAPAQSNEEDASLSIAASLVQGWTLKSGSEDYRFDYRTVYQPRQPIKGPVILFGTRDALLDNGWINENIYQEIQGAYLGLAQQEKDDKWVLVVSGNSNYDVKKAAKVFANNVRRMPEKTSIIITSEDEIVDRSLRSEATYPLSDFTRQTDLTDRPLELDLVMPSNILFSHEDNAKLNLLLTHTRVSPGAGSMILRVNGKYANSLPLRYSYWRDTQHYRFNIPLRDIEPGINRVTVEIYGPVDIKNQKRRFSVYMSDKSNLRLSSWVKYIPAEDHQVSPRDFLALSDDCGRNAQISIASGDEEQLANLWRLISHVSHRTHKAMPGLMVTTRKQQQRPIHISFQHGPDTELLLSEEEVGQTNRWAALKHQLFGFVADAHADDDLLYTDLGYSTFSDRFATVQHSEKEGWYRIQFGNVNAEEFSQFLLKKDSKPPVGALAEREFASNTSQVMKAAFIGYPAGLSVLVLLIIWWMSAVMARYLEARR